MSGDGKVVQLPRAKPREVVPRMLLREELVTAREFLRSGHLCVETAADAIEAADNAHTTLIQFGEVLDGIDELMQQIQYCIDHMEER